MYSLIVFDFDGTLADSERCIAGAMTAALEECGCSCTLRDLRRHIGLPLADVVRGLAAHLSDAAVAQAIQSYRRHYAALEMDGDYFRLFDGVADLLQQLAAGTQRLAIASSKRSSGLRRTLKRLQIDRYFAEVVGVDDVVKGKPDPEMLQVLLRRMPGSPDDAVMVGDTTFDVQMAAAAGVASCAVTYGNHTADELTRMGPTHIVHSPQELARVLAR